MSEKSFPISVALAREAMQGIHDSGVHLTLEWRRRQLLKMKRMVHENLNALRAALLADLGKQWTEASITEISIVLDEIEQLLSRIPTWIKPEYVASPIGMIPCRSRIEKRPLAPPGVLVIGPSNFPILICLTPAIGSLAAGNPTLIKPSELALHTAALLAKLVPQYFPDKELQVLEGGLSETTELLKNFWGCIVFTGSQRVGKIVATAAAQTLSPLVLELGGKCPCWIDETCPSDTIQVANRIVWSKVINAGQTCAAVDYLLVHEKVADEIKKQLVPSLWKQLGKDPKNSEVGRMIHRSHAERQVDILKEIEAYVSNHRDCEILCGGSKACDPASCYIAPTIVWNPPEHMRIWKEEIFGPILPIQVVASRQEAVARMKTVSGVAPLCLYVFTANEAAFMDVVNHVPAGSVVRNDCVIQLLSGAIPFGGLGSSGYGQYRGKWSLETFSHILPVIYRPCAFGADLRMLRYHPFGKYKSRFIVELLKLPYIPVLSRFWGLVGLLLLLAVLLFVSPTNLMWRESTLVLASLLERLAAWLRDT